MSTYFIAGIDTDAGKSIATGLLAKFLLSKGVNVITQKLAQTGCLNVSEDIETHRNLMGVESFEEDETGLTCPYIFKFPASPHLSASMENVEIDINKISEATKVLENKYETVLLEGVGGVYVPLVGSYSTLDYLQEKKYPVILVSSAKLGSINHTLMTLDLLHSRGVEVKGIIYNLYVDSSEQIIADSKNVFKMFLKKFGYPQVVVDMPKITEGVVVDDFFQLI
ncbi:MAG: ATP-dependent dethiobiotin synthetase BioD [Ichthyobacteriaceae bacterium]|nr:ATP-dependent dethiobiotin synthetase BioD [Ichthyobacteriaceae bacterium]